MGDRVLPQLKVNAPHSLILMCTAITDRLGSIQGDDHVINVSCNVSSWLSNGLWVVDAQSAVRTVELLGITRS